MGVMGGGYDPAVAVLPLAESASPALLALAGTVVGALIGALTNVVIARSGRRDDALASARLVESDLAVALEVVKEWRHDLPEPPPKASVAKLRMEAWEEFRVTLAHALKRREWDAVRDGCAAAEQVPRVYERAASEITVGDLKKAEVAIKKALDTLRREDSWIVGNRLVNWFRRRPRRVKG